MTATTPLRCANSVMAADPGAASGKKVVLLDTGNYPSFSTYLNETWEFTGTNWVNTSASLVNTNGPVPGRSNGIMAYDGTNVMLYGGQGGSSAAGVLNDTWVWSSSGQTWTQAAPTTVPYGRYKAAAAYLLGSGTVMFGGENLLYKLLETWVWNGTTWTQVTVANGAGPAARTDHVMAASTTEIVMFGGEGTNSQFNDTWTFNGSTWTQLTPATSPSVRSDACMAFDSVNNIFVMFGGKNEYNYLNETWTFNGTTWSQVAHTNGTGPAGRVGAQMAFDTQSGTTIMYGGISAGDNYPSNATWSFNGATLTWTLL